MTDLLIQIWAFLSHVAGLVGQQLAHMASPSMLWQEVCEFTAVYPLAMCLLWIVFAFLYVIFREWRQSGDPKYKPTVAVVVAAHNEELVIADTLEALLAQDYPGLEIHVVSDGSTDGTVEIARRYGQRGVIVHDLQPNRGKCRALQHALDRAGTELLVVVDADTQPAPQAIRHLIQQMADPRVAAVTGNPRVRNLSNLLTRLQALEYSVVVGLSKRAEQFWGGLYTVSGAAACFRTQVLREVGGWLAISVTEDIEMSWRIQRAGHLIRYEPRALFHIQAPETVKGLFRQRQRWAQGSAEVLRANWNLLDKQNPALIPIAMQVGINILWAVFALGAFAEGTWWMIKGGPMPMLLKGVSAPDAWIVFACTMSAFLMQSITALTFDGHYIRRLYKLLPFAVLYPLYFWLIIFPSFVTGFSKGLGRLGQDARWTRTARTAESPVAPAGQYISEASIESKENITPRPITRQSQEIG